MAVMDEENLETKKDTGGVVKVRFVENAAAAVRLEKE